jgi:hypothetical protein
MLHGCRMRRHLGGAAEMDTPPLLLTKCQVRSELSGLLSPSLCREPESSKARMLFAFTEAKKPFFRFQGDFCFV